ncbi:MAG: adenylosuccinate synthase [Bacteroidales bacterium]
MSSKADILLGLQWGDEGKGKIVDVLTPNYDVVARFQGGPNAGHTLEFNGIKQVLHTIPSGIFREGCINIIGNGVVIDPAIFKKEIENLKTKGFDISKNLLISNKASVILPTHRLLDQASEEAKGKSKIGSTLKGIGPAYRDKIGREGLRIGDIFSDFNSKYEERKKRHISILSSQYNFDYTSSLAEYEKEWLEGIECIKQFATTDSEYFINDSLESGKSVLAEGAQGTLLDIDFGSYPFVTSSNTVTAGACTGLGISPSKIGKVIGIFKAYCTRVGSGPFPTELFDNDGETMRKNGHEFGSTTGRPRRCGWLDLVALKYAIMINGVTELYMMKGDVLSGFDTLKVCTSYKINGKETDKFPYEIDSTLEPVYTEVKGWSEDITTCTTYKTLPSAFADYVKFIEEYTGISVTVVSVGPDRKQTIIR